MFKQILVPVDLSHEDHIQRLIQVAEKLASDEGATLNLLYVDQSLIHGAGYPHLDKSSVAAHQKDAIATMEKHLQELPVGITGKSLCREGTAHDQILETASKIKADAVVMMAKKPGLTSYFIGSNAERVVRHAGCSVFVIRE